MTHFTDAKLDDGESQARYGEPEYIAYDEPANAREIVYPNSWTVPASLHSGMPETVEEAEPALFFRPDLPPEQPVSDWSPQTIGLIANGQPVRLLARNTRRTRLVVMTDSSNTASVILYGDASSNGSGPGSGSIQLAPNSLPLEMRHTGEVYAASTAAALVYFFEEAAV